MGVAGMSPGKSSQPPWDSPKSFLAAFVGSRTPLGRGPPVAVSEMAPPVASGTSEHSWLWLKGPRPATSFDSLGGSGPFASLNPPLGAPKGAPSASFCFRVQSRNFSLMDSPSLRLRSCACFSSSWRDAFCCWYLLAQRSPGAYWQHTALAKSLGLRRTSSAYSADRPMTWFQKQSRTFKLITLISLSPQKTLKPSPKSQSSLLCTGSAGPASSASLCICASASRQRRSSELPAPSAKSGAPRPLRRGRGSGSGLCGSGGARAEPAQKGEEKPNLTSLSLRKKQPPAVAISGAVGPSSRCGSLAILPGGESRRCCFKQCGNRLCGGDSKEEEGTVCDHV